MLKNILVHIDSGARSKIRLALAAALARRHGARLAGLFAQRAGPHFVGVVPVWPSEAYSRAAEASRTGFAVAVAGVERAEWRDSNRGSDAEVLHAVVEAARCHDLVVLGQAAEDEHFVPEDLVEHAIRESGRPVLVVPSAGNVESLGRRPLFAWNGSRESARAINDALPLVMEDAATLLLSIGSSTKPTEVSGDAILTHLACHGVRAVAERLVAGDAGVVNDLLNHVAEHGADLLVLGASTGLPLHGRGTLTRQLLSQITAPALIAH